MLNSSRDKNEGTHRSGEGGGGPAMWPRICVSTGRERESSARKKMDEKEKGKGNVCARVEQQ